MNYWGDPIQSTGHRYPTENTFAFPAIINVSGKEIKSVILGYKETSTTLHPNLVHRIAFALMKNPDGSIGIIPELGRFHILSLERHPKHHTISQMASDQVYNNVERRKHLPRIFKPVKPRLGDLGKIDHGIELPGNLSAAETNGIFIFPINKERIQTSLTQINIKVGKDFPLMLLKGKQDRQRQKALTSNLSKFLSA